MRRGPAAPAEPVTSLHSHRADVSRNVSVLGSRHVLVINGTVEQRIAAITARQHNRISRMQLHAAGLTDAQIRRRVRIGQLRREHPSVYVVVAAQVVSLGRETGALLSMRPGAVISHDSAAALWKIGRGDRDVHVLVTGGPVRPRAGVRVHRTRELPPRDVRVNAGLPVTSPARTLRDCAAHCTTDELERMFTEALTLRLVDPGEIETKGDRRLRHLVEAEREGVDLRSDTERRLRALIRRTSLPAPRYNASLHGFIGDLYWPDHALVVEVDSYGFHNGRWAYERDRRKDATFRAHGIETMRFSRPQILDEPLLVIAQIARELGRRN